jgi:hypothetical protein
MTPTVGRIVHYVARGSADGVFPKTCRAAIITEVDLDQNTGHEGNVMLCVLNPQGIFFDSCDYDEGHIVEKLFRRPEYTPGTWHWPERVD